MSTHPVPLFPHEDKARKMLPMFKFITGYFPRAIREMCKVSVVNNVRYNPGREANDINWARGKSPHQMDSALKHMMEHADGKVFDTIDPEVARVTGIERIYILAQSMWRIGAELELLIEKTELEEQQAIPKAGIRDTSQPIPGDVIQKKCKCGKRVFAYRAGELPPQVQQGTVMHGVAACGEPEPQKKLDGPPNCPTCGTRAIKGAFNPPGKPWFCPKMTCGGGYFNV